MLFTSKFVLFCLTFGACVISRPVTDNKVDISPRHLTSCDEIFEAYPKCPNANFAQWEYSNLPKSQISITNVELVGGNSYEVTVHFKSDHTMSLSSLSELKIMTPVNTFIFSRNGNVKLITNPGDFTYTFTVGAIDLIDGTRGELCIPAVSFQFDWCLVGVLMTKLNVIHGDTTSLMIFTLVVKIQSIRAVLCTVSEKRSVLHLVQWLHLVHLQLHRVQVLLDPASITGTDNGSSSATDSSSTTGFSSASGTSNGSSSTTGPSSATGSYSILIGTDNGSSSATGSSSLTGTDNGSSSATDSSSATGTDNGSSSATGTDNGSSSATDSSSATGTDNGSSPTGSDNGSSATGTDNGSSNSY